MLLLFFFFTLHTERLYFGMYIPGALGCKILEYYVQGIYLLL